MNVTIIWITAIAAILLVVCWLFRQAHRIIRHERVRWRYTRKAVWKRDQLIKISNGVIDPVDIIVAGLYWETTLAMALAGTLDSDDAMDELRAITLKAAVIAGKKQLEMVRESYTERLNGLGLICLLNLLLAKELGCIDLDLERAIPEAISFAQPVRA